MIAIFAPLGGRLVDLYGSRLVLMIGLSLLAAGSIIIALNSSKIVFIFALGGISAIGFGLIAVHVTATAVEQQFDKIKAWQPA